MNQNSIKRNSKWMTILLYLILFIVLSISQTYVAMYKFSDQMSGDLTTGYLEGIAIGALISSVLYLPFVIFITRIRSFTLQLTIHGVFVALLLLIQSHAVFVDREAGWSTYSFSESLNYAVMYSIYPIMASILIFCILSFFMKKNI